MTKEKETKQQEETQEIIENQPTQEIKYWIGGKQDLDIMFRDFLFSLRIPSGVSLVDLGEYCNHLQQVVGDILKKREEADKTKEQEETHNG